jgi:hypothetical protein
MDDQLEEAPPQPHAFAQFLSIPWRQAAACRGMAPRGPDVDKVRHSWFPEWGETQQPAKDVCFTCPVRVQCLEFALETEERYGIWGGLSRIERDYCAELMKRGIPTIMAIEQAQDFRKLKRELGIDPFDNLETDAKIEDRFINGKLDGSEPVVNS